MLSVLLTSFQELRTIRQAIDACLSQLGSEDELLVIAPDDATRDIALAYQAQDARVRYVADYQRGKPAALNIGKQAARHEILVLTDGDVYIAEHAVNALKAALADEQVGAVTARPISTSPRDTMLGYWSHLLTDAAHAARERRAAESQFLLCSGYLFAYRKSLVPHIPEDALAEDAVISHRIAEQGKRIAYAPQAHVFVKYPATYRDWLRQKVRSAGGYTQSYVTQSPVKMRSAWLEIRDGALFALRYPKTWRERLWTLALFMARLHLWLLVYWRVRVRKLPLTTLWKRVVTTK